MRGYCLQHTDRHAHSRGRCKPCYNSIMRMIRNGDITDRQAVRRGYLLPVSVSDRKCMNDSNKHYARGLCIKCYRSVWDRISNGSLLESRAIKDKMILPSRRKE